MPLFAHAIGFKRLFRLLFLVLPVLLIACTAPSADQQDKNWTDPTNLVSTSDRVLIARFVESREVNIQRIDSSTGAVASDTDVLFRQFELFETVKGTSDAGDLLWVAFVPGRTGELVDGEGAVQDFREGETYVLFLKGRLRPLEYPTEFGPVLWTGNGEPAFAKLLGDRLEFRAERPYLDLILRDEQSLPDSPSAAPFALTLEEVRKVAK